MPELYNTVDRLRSQVAELTAKLQAAEAEVARANHRANLSELAFESKRQQVAQLRAENERLNAHIQMWQPVTGAKLTLEREDRIRRSLVGRSIASEDDLCLAMTEVDSLRQEREQLRADLAAAAQRIEPFVVQNIDLKAKIGELESANALLRRSLEEA